jgi:SAM-dependent methyltransferase
MIDLGNLKGRGPVLIALAAQLAAALVTLGAIQAHHALTGNDLPPWGKVAIACAVAGGVSRVCRAPIGWTLLMAALPALFVGLLWLDPPPWLPPVILVALVLLLRNSLGDRVPLYLSNRPTLDALTELIPSDQPIRAIDLGCGFAAAPLALARANAHPDSRFVGVENAPIPFLIAKLRAMVSGDGRVSIEWASIWDVDLSNFDLIYVFLSPHPMPGIYDKARAEASAGTLLVSNSFTVPGHPPDREIPLAAGRATGLLIWRLPQRRME